MVNVEVNFKKIKDVLRKAQEHCLSKDKKSVTESSPELWNKAYKNRNLIDKAYDDMYNCMLTAYETITALINDVEALHEAADEAKEGSSHQITEVIKAELQENLITVVKEAVKEVAIAANLKKSFTEIVKQNKHDIKEETGKAFKQSLTEALHNNQATIVDKAKEKQDWDHWERQRRARNIVVSGVQESKEVTANDRMAADKTRLSELLDIDESEILRCFRVPLKDTTKLRPLVATLKTPNAASELHYYGNGRKLNGDIWVNPDLTSSEREAAYRARNVRRALIAEKEAARQARQSASTTNTRDIGPNRSSGATAVANNTQDDTSGNDI